MLQPPQVLRSNAPPVGDDPVLDSNVAQHASRVLQEQSGNQQLNEYTSAAVADGYEHKNVVHSQQQTSPTENAWPATSILTQPHQPRYYNVPAQTHYPQPYVKQTNGYGAYRPRWYGHYAGDEAQHITRHATQLWKRFQDSDSYRKYRNRQQKDAKSEKDRKWPDHLEEAFFRALVQWPPMGRQQVWWKDKQRGRNELIADHIQEMTGEGRTRKQVSSHIQVLKPFVEHDPYIMKYLSKGNMGVHRGHHSYHGYHGDRYTAGHKASTYPAAAQSHATRHALQAYPTDMTAVRKIKHHLDIFVPRSFSMFIQRKFVSPVGEEQSEILHTYTVNIEDPLGPDKYLQDRSELQNQYPQLAAMDDQSPLNCNVLVANTSLAFPTQTFASKAGVELGISFVCSSHRLPAHTANVKCRTSFYQAGRLLQNKNGIRKDAIIEFNVDFSHAEDGSSVTRSMKFGSGCWAQELSRIASMRKAALTDGSIDPQEGVSAELQQISVIQEVFVLEQNHDQRERILVILWQFRQSSGETGRASWRKLVLPRRESAKEGIAIDDTYAELKTERADSMYDYTACSQYTEVPISQQSAGQPALQSPFEYNEEGTGAANWPSAADSGVTHSHPVSSFDNNDFDFNAGNINLAFDPSPMEYGTFDSTFDTNAFDSTAFDFDNAGVEFPQDPALEQFTGPWYDNSNSTKTYVTPQEMPLDAINHDSNYGIPQAQPGGDSQPTARPHSQEYSTQQHYEHTTYSAADEEGIQYGISSEQQAFGGAGQDGFKHDPLATLADASYMARSVETQQSRGAEVGNE